jgi:hypothetical protein
MQTFWGGCRLLSSNNDCCDVKIICQKGTRYSHFAFVIWIIGIRKLQMHKPIQILSGGGLAHCAQHPYL